MTGRSFVVILTLAVLISALLGYTLGPVVAPRTVDLEAPTRVQALLRAEEYAADSRLRCGGKLEALRVASWSDPRISLYRCGRVLIAYSTNGSSRALAMVVEP